MAQFDVYKNPNEETNQTVPYLLDLQADLLDNLATRVVAPLIAAALMGGAVKHLNPRFKVKDNTVFMSTAELAGVPISAVVDPDDPFTVFVNNYGGGNFKSVDGAETWINASNGYTGAHLHDIAIDQNNGVYSRGHQACSPAT